MECTNRCNARCVFCLYPEIEAGLSTQILAEQDYEDIVQQYTKMGGRKLALTPTLADPLTDPKFPARLEIAARKKIKELSFYTNLISFGPAVQTALRENTDMHLKIRISFTGLTGSSTTNLWELIDLREFRDICFSLGR